MMMLTKRIVRIRTVVMMVTLTSIKAASFSFHAEQRRR